MKTAVYTHNDLDGVACGILLKKFLDDKVDVKFCNYSNVDKQLEALIFDEEKLGTYDKVFITDICPSKDVCQQLDLINSTKIYLFDHHITKTWVDQYPWATVNTSYCGAELVYQYIRDTVELSEFLKHVSTEFTMAVSAWDLWKTESSYRARGEKLNALLSFIGLYAFLSEFTERLNSDQDNVFKNIITYIEDNKKRYIQKIISRQLGVAPRFMDGLGQTYKVIFVNEFVSDVGHAILDHKDEEDLHYIVLVDSTNNRCSLRSKGDVDVAKIAKQLRGGGHKAAAGFIYDFRRKCTTKISKLLTSIEPNE